MRSNGIAALALSVALAVVGCQKKVYPPPPPLASVPAPAAAPPAPNVLPLEQANRAFLANNYDEATRLYESLLPGSPATTDREKAEREKALFYSAIIYALRPAPAADWSKALVNLKQLVTEYPNSPLKGPANALLALRSDLDLGSAAIAEGTKKDQRIRQLTTELDRLKKIDADRRKRP
jgi:hypothetical protein